MEQQENPTIENNTTTKVSRVPRLPNKEEDLKNLAQRVLGKWQEDKMELRYKKITDFEKDVQDFSQTLVLRGEKGDKRRPVSQLLRDLDKEINLHIEDVKAYIKSEKGAKQAEPFYAQFGIEKQAKDIKYPQTAMPVFEILKNLYRFWTLIR